MATFHRCDRCGAALKSGEQHPVTIGRAVISEGAYASIFQMWTSGPQEQRPRIDYSAFEYCLGCARALAVLLNKAKLDVQRTALGGIAE